MVANDGQCWEKFLSKGGDGSLADCAILSSATAEHDALPPQIVQQAGAEGDQLLRRRMLQFRGDLAAAVPRRWSVFRRAGPAAAP